MAEPDRQTSDSLAAEMALRPHEFNFFQAVRRLEAEHPAWPRVGSSDRLEEDYLRFCQIPSLAFAPSSIEAIERVGAGHSDVRQLPWHVRAKRTVTAAVDRFRP